MFRLGVVMLSKHDISMGVAERCVVTASRLCGRAETGSGTAFEPIEHFLACRKWH